MSLGPDQLKRIEAGDRMRVSGEVQVSTTCVDPRTALRRPPLRVQPDGSPRGSCSPPRLSRRRRRSRSPRPSRPSASSGGRTETTTARSRFPTSRRRSATPATLPCAGQRLLREHDPRRLEQATPAAATASSSAPTGPTARSKQDKGRLNVVQARAEVPAPAGSVERRAGQRRAAADRGQEGEAPGRLLGRDRRAGQGRGARLRRRLDRDDRPAPLQHLHLLAGDRRRAARPRPIPSGIATSAVAAPRRRHRGQRLQLHPGPERLRHPVHDASRPARSGSPRTPSTRLRACRRPCT